MTILSRYKRKCNICGKTIDIVDTISMVWGKKHACKTCAGKRLNKYMYKKKR